MSGTELCFRSKRINLHKLLTRIARHIRAASPGLSVRYFKFYYKVEAGGFLSKAVQMATSETEKRCFAPADHCSFKSVHFEDLTTAESGTDK